MRKNAVCLTMVGIVVLIYFLGHTDVPHQQLDKETIEHKQLEILLENKLEPSAITLSRLEKIVIDTQKQVIELQKAIRQMNTALVKQSSIVPQVVCNCEANSTNTSTEVEMPPPVEEEKEGAPPESDPSKVSDAVQDYINDLPTEGCVDLSVLPISKGKKPGPAKGVFVYLAPPKAHERYIKRIHLLSFSIQRIEIFFHRQLKLYTKACTRLAILTVLGGRKT